MYKEREMTLEESQKVIDALKAVCDQMGVIIIGVDSSECTYGEIEIISKDEAYEMDLMRATNTPYIDIWLQKSVVVDGIG